MNILFYTPVNFRCRDIESLAKKYLENGHQVFLLSQCKPGSLHESFQSMGMSATAVPVQTRGPLLKIALSVHHLVSFCRNNKIDLLYSHLEPTNFVSVVAQYFLKARVVIYRHHVDLARLHNFDKSFTYKLTYRLARNIISVSEEGRRYMIAEEKVQENKIQHINLGYDFSLYGTVNDSVKDVLKRKYKKDILLVIAGSLTKYKRPEIAIELVKRAKLEGINATLLVLGKGEEEENLKQKVRHLQLEDSIFFVGYISNILDYLSAADLLVHPSVSESSCVVIKEAGLTETPVAVCKGIGDFDSYIKHQQNGLVLDKDNFIDEALVHLHQFLSRPEYYYSLGGSLKKDIVSTFSIENTFDRYMRYAVQA